MQVSSATGAQAQDMARQMRERNFSRADRDGDGGLSLNEFAALGPTTGAPTADPAEVKAVATLSAAVFDRVDANGDGTVTEAELEATSPGGPLQAAALASATMSALLSGQEASGSRLSGLAAARKDGNIIAGPAEPPAALAEALDKYLQFGAGQPSADPPAGG
ncbi:EF-hand domain-containing protein [Muricoccus vinaceus]|uniref:EF-hand domain-containing protein n=1 Tax=Muricoccus vinaceus TaxID=424704 RepID=A0ABV6IX05_9PROT